MQSQKFPQESRIIIPSRFWKLIPSRFWKLITCRVHASLPDHIQRLFPTRAYNRVILSKLQRKDRPRRSSSYPQRSSSNPPTGLINGIPSGVIIHLRKVPLFPHRVHSPQSNLSAKFIPQRSHRLLPVFLQSSPAETKKLYSSNISLGFDFPAVRQGFMFLDKNTLIDITSLYIIACTYAS